MTDREALAALLMREGIAVENVASMGNAEQWLPDYALADRLIAAGVHLGDEGLRAALATIDAKVAAYATQEANSAERHDWSRADRFRYLAMGNAEAVETIRAALAAQENPEAPDD